MQNTPSSAWPAETTRPRQGWFVRQPWKRTPPLGLATSTVSSKPTDARPKLVCIVGAAQNLSRGSFSGHSAYFLEHAGLSPAKAYDFALAQYSINLARVLGAWFLVNVGIG